MVGPPYDGLENIDVNKALTGFLINSSSFLRRRTSQKVYSELEKGWCKIVNGC